LQISFDVTFDDSEFERINFVVDERGRKVDGVDIAVNVPRYDIEHGSLFDVHESSPRGAV
jgi:hypothetical protein